MRALVLAPLLPLVSLLSLTLACATPRPAPPRPPPPPKADPAPPPRPVDDHAAHITAIERGIVPPGRIKGRVSHVTLMERMAALHVPAVSIAVVIDHRVAWAKAYGAADVAAVQPATETTLFQAGSMSKPVTALAALQAVEKAQLALDAPINDTLTSWKLPENALTQATPVTLRQLLSHTAGTTVHGFVGYALDAPLPSVPEILDGRPPANTPPVRVDLAPGSKARYSGGGLMIVEQALTDRLKRSFPELLRESVLAPLGMTRSTFDQPLAPERRAEAASGYTRDGSPRPGKWRVQPEHAAAGLWTTPTDLARFFAEIDLASLGRSTKISAQIAAQMLTPVAPLGRERVGLGMFLSGAPVVTHFGHGGLNEGFEGFATMRLGKGHGVVVMVNSDHGRELLDDVKRTISVEYGWDDVEGAATPVPLPPAQLATLAGRFATGVLRPFTLVVKGTSLWMERPFSPTVELVPIGGDAFLGVEDGAHCQVKPDEVSCNRKDGTERSTRLADGQTAPLFEIAAGRYDGALAALRALQKKDPRSPALAEDRLDFLGADLMFHKNDPQHGLIVLRLNQVLHPDQIRPYASLGGAYSQLGERDKAITIYEAGLKVLKHDRTIPASRKEKIRRAAERQIALLKRGQQPPPIPPSPPLAD